MASEHIHLEALRKQKVMDCRDHYGVKRKMYNPPFQSVYMVNELPKDDMYCIAKQDVYQNKCNVHQFVNKGSQPQYEFTSNPLAAAAAAAASRYASASNLESSSSSFSSSSSTPAVGYTAKMPNRLNNMNYKSQW